MVVETLSVLYEVGCLKLSPGFQPGRSPRQARAALHAALMSRSVSWTLDDGVDWFAALTRQLPLPPVNITRP